MYAHRPQDQEGLSSNLADLSISSSARGQSQTRYEGPGLLQDESMDLLAKGGGLAGMEDESLMELGGDDSFYGNDVDDQTIRLPPPVPATTNSEEGAGLNKSRNRNENPIEFGGSMASSISRGHDSGFPTASTSRSNEPAGSQQDVNEREEQEDEDDLLLVLEDEGCSPEDKERIRQLRSERDQLRGMNKILRDVVASLRKTEANMSELQDASNTSHELLDLYSKICSQAEHTKDLILDEEWKGLDADEQYLLEKQQAQLQEAERIRLEAEEERERLLAEEQEREDRQRREAEEAERRRKAGPGASAGAGRGRGLVRGSTSGGRVLVRGTRARPTTITASASTRGGRIPTPSDTSSSFSSGIPTFSSTSGRGSAAVSGVRGVRGLRSRGGVSGIGRGRGGIV